MSAAPIGVRFPTGFRGPAPEAAGPGALTVPIGRQRAGRRAEQRRCRRARSSAARLTLRRPHPQGPSGPALCWAGSPRSWMNVTVPHVPPFYVGVHIKQDSVIVSSCMMTFSPRPGRSRDGEVARPLIGKSILALGKIERVTANPQVMGAPAGVTANPPVMDTHAGVTANPQVMGAPAGVTANPPVMDAHEGVTANPWVMDAPAGVTANPQVMGAPAGVTANPQVMGAPAGVTANPPVAGCVLDVGTFRSLSSEWLQFSVSAPPGPSSAASLPTSMPVLLLF
ncbi:hypothetical protein LEMLEM_LOCUS21736 [Lemmus lemmus]